MPVKIDAVRPPVRTEKFSELLSFPGEPRQGAGMSVGNMHRFDGAFFSLTKSLVKAARDPRVALVHVLAHHQDMHDGKDLGSFVVVDFHFLVIGKQPSDFPRTVAKTRRAAGRNERVDLSALEHTVEGPVIGNRLDAYLRRQV